MTTTTLCPCGAVATIFCSAGALCDACFSSLCPCCGVVVPEGVEHTFNFDQCPVHDGVKFGPQGVCTCS